MVCGLFPDPAYPTTSRLKRLSCGVSMGTTIIFIDCAHCPDTRARTVVGRRIDVIVEQASGDGRRRSVGVPLRLRQPQFVLVHERRLLARPLGLRHRRSPVRTTGGRRLLLARGRGGTAAAGTPLAERLRTDGKGVNGFVYIGTHALGIGRCQGRTPGVWDED